jgi:hypothetical protein
LKRASDALTQGHEARVPVDQGSPLFLPKAGILRDGLYAP